MKVLLINGSPHEKGCTYTALSLIAQELNAGGIDTEILHVGGKPVGGCIGCCICFCAFSISCTNLSSAFFSTSAEILPPLIMIATTLVLTSSCIAAFTSFPWNDYWDCCRS